MLARQVGGCKPYCSPLKGHSMHTVSACQLACAAHRGRQLPLTSCHLPSTPACAELFECFTVPPRMMAYTQSPAEAEPQPVSAGAVSQYHKELETVAVPSVAALLASQATSCHCLCP